MAVTRQEQQPARAGVEEVAPGVLRAQLPMDLPGLRHVNCYLIPDGEGVALVDPGMPGSQSYDALVIALGIAGFDTGHVHTVLMTHSHPDHFGGAGRLVAESGARLVSHSAFRVWWPEEPDPCVQVHDVDPEDLPDENPWAKPSPWGGDAHARGDREAMRRELVRSGFVVPSPTVRLRDGDHLVLGGRSWQAVHTPGHTLDHLCLLDEEGGVLLSGDHVLPTITPHISGIAAGRDPLSGYKASLDKVALLPDLKITLPAHGLEIEDLPARVNAIQQHHHERLDKVRAIGDALGEADVEAFTHELFRPQVWGPMAESEAYAHLEHLRLAGQAERREVDGRLRYRITG